MAQVDSVQLGYRPQCKWCAWSVNRVVHKSGNTNEMRRTCDAPAIRKWLEQFTGMGIDWISFNGDKECKSFRRK